MRQQAKEICKDTEVKKNYNILGLDYLEPTLKTTLREVIMGIRSREDPQQNFFIAVDKMVTSNTVLFAYHKDLGY